MSALSLRLPKSLHERLRELAQEEGISVNQFVMLADAEKIVAIEYVEKRAKRGSREKFFGNSVITYPLLECALLHPHPAGSPSPLIAARFDKNRPAGKGG